MFKQSDSYGFEIGWASHTESNYWVGKTYSFAQNLPDFLAIFKLLCGQLPTLPPITTPMVDCEKSLIHKMEIYFILYETVCI